MQENSIDALEVRGYENWAEGVLGVGASSYVFFGENGTLDYSFSSPVMTTQVTTAAEWRINAEGPPVLDYNGEFKPAAYNVGNGNEFRTSEHNPLVIGLDFCIDLDDYLAALEDIQARSPRAIPMAMASPALWTPAGSF